MSKKFLSLEGDIENISCEGTVEYKNNTYHVQIIVSQWALHTYHSILLKDLRHPQPHPQAERRRMRKTQKYPEDQEFQDSAIMVQVGLAQFLFWVSYDAGHDYDHNHYQLGMDGWTADVDIALCPTYVG